MNSTLVERGAAYKMLLDGTVQAGSTHIPSLFMHKTLAETLDCINGIADTRFNDRIKVDSKELRIALDNVNPKIDIKTALQESKGCQNVCAAIGSERGWTDRERTQLEGEGFIRAGMGERIMRTETAATAAAAIISCFTGMMTERRGNEI